MQYANMLRIVQSGHNLSFAKFQLLENCKALRGGCEAIIKPNSERAMVG